MLPAEALIRRMLESLLPALSRRVVVFLSGGTVNEGCVARILADYPLYRYSLVIDDSPGLPPLDETLLSRLSARRLSGLAEIEQALREAELVLIPLATRGTLSKIALGIADSPLTAGIAAAIMQRKEIVAVRDGYDPLHTVQAAAGLGGNGAYNRMLLGYERTLQDFGVKVVTLAEFRETLITHGLQSEGAPAAGISPGSGRPADLNPPNAIHLPDSVITLADVQHIPGGTLSAREDAIITPLARELLEARRIELRFLKK
ncbi:hypothetical protein GNQ08_05715 [Paenibacillus macerans]|uniref:Flavoprotein n=1 Tax=Paenibacillus macerans TaxID=44252 RepID=A0A6N8EQL5_PAEMA|nr:hypothetical protein [Paenibacillus macerans]MUG21925.1 hypothetical protein [Paenibacillus macerans]OMG46508.1 hypothetical protein BK140_26370 [Paenibacillus macerans]GBK64681.1 hypothetical protein PbDSM24746_46850 [Paenibacillus macerans]GBK70885.1 hypothetical protein PbJCM17693_45930 [Paenibacillus macerans]